MKYVRLIFGGKVLNYERHVTYKFNFLFIESIMKDLNHTRVTKFGWMKTVTCTREQDGDSLFIVQILTSDYIPGAGVYVSVKFTFLWSHVFDVSKYTDNPELSQIQASHDRF